MIIIECLGILRTEENVKKKPPVQVTDATDGEEGDVRRASGTPSERRFASFQCAVMLLSAAKVEKPRTAALYPDALSCHDVRVTVRIIAGFESPNQEERR